MIASDMLRRTAVVLALIAILGARPAGAFSFEEARGLARRALGGLAHGPSPSLSFDDLARLRQILAYIDEIDGQLDAANRLINEYRAAVFWRRSRLFNELRTQVERIKATSGRTSVAFDPLRPRSEREIEIVRSRLRAQHTESSDLLGRAGKIMTGGI